MKFIGHLFIFLFLSWTLVECQDTLDNETTLIPTKAMPVVSTTPSPIATELIPSTTTESPIGNWTVADINDTICLMVEMNAHFVLQYNMTNNTFHEVTVALPPSASVSAKSSCDGTIILDFENNELKLDFGKKDDGKVALVNITLHIFYDNETFPDHAEEEHTYSAMDQNFFEAADGKSYMCKANEDITLSDNSKIKAEDVQVQAFTKSSDGKFASADECTADEGDLSDIVPIAVGCALAGLVVIVLIAYLVGRRHKRQKGYESV